MTKKIHNEEVIHNFLKNNDPLAFQHIYDLYCSSLFGVIRIILRGRNDIAEDVLQETFIKIWLHRENYDKEKGTFFTWMLNTARNTAIDKLRSKEFTNNPVNHIPLDTVSIDESLDTTTVEIDDEVHLNTIVATLPSEQKQIIDLMYFQGYTQSEISKEFGIPLGTVKSRARLAIESLRKLMNEGDKTNNMSHVHSMSNIALIIILLTVEA